jgi:hypothetical protein
MRAPRTEREREGERKRERERERERKRERNTIIMLFYNLPKDASIFYYRYRIKYI